MFDESTKRTSQADHHIDKYIAGCSARANGVKALLAENEHLYDAKKISQPVYEKRNHDGRMNLYNIIDEYEEFCRKERITNPGLLP